MEIKVERFLPFLEAAAIALTGCQLPELPIQYVIRIQPRILTIRGDPICDYLNRFRARELSVRSDLTFVGRIRVVKLPAPIAIGDNDGQRLMVELSDFPSRDFGWLQRPPIRTNPPQGAYREVIEVTNPVTGDTLYWVEHTSSIGRGYVLLGDPDGLYSSVYQDGRRLDEDALYRQLGDRGVGCN